MASANSTARREREDRTTDSKTFFPCGSTGHPLFAVREGIPALDALEQVSTFLSAAHDAAKVAAMTTERDEGGVMWTCAYLIEVAKATLDSAVSSMAREAGHADRAAPAEEPAPADPADPTVAPTAEDLAEAVEAMHAHAKDGFAKIEALANLARKSLQLPETYRNPDDLAEALRSIAYVAMDTGSVIGVEAEGVGCNSIDEPERDASRARWDAMHAARTGQP